MMQADGEMSRRAGGAMLVVGAVLAGGFLVMWFLMDRSGDPLYRRQDMGDYSEPIQERYGADSVGARRTPEVEIEPLPPPSPPASRPAGEEGN